MMIVSKKKKRKLQSGFTWQSYGIKAIKIITKTDMDTRWDGLSWKMREEFAIWRNHITDFIVQRTDDLGLHLERAIAQLIEEPNEHKSIEVLIWDQRGAVYIWSCWAYIDGPVPGEAKQDTTIPLLGFWPNDTIHHGAVAEIFDAQSLSAVESSSEPEKIVIPT
jgi:hypothetical protein